MTAQEMIPFVVGGGVLGLVTIVTLVSGRKGNAQAEKRLEDLTGGKRAAKSEAAANLLMRPRAIDLGGTSFWNKVVPNAENLNRLFEQADVSLGFNQFMLIVGGLAASGLVAGLLFHMPILLIPIAAGFLGALPFLWLKQRKASRVKKFMTAMPEAVELVSRALRAGHGLASGMHLVSEEMKGPIADEFGRVFEEQNLGIPIEVSLRGLADRIPTMDVRFFVIAVIVQRSTGGDLAEVLDKIGRLIRERFELFGHVKGLTAEGRLSGLILLALPPGLLGFLSFSNYNYVSVLFTTPIGTKMLAITAVLQTIGALVIKKIVAIKV